MTISVAASTFCRPILSPSQPKTTPPRGRARKVAANVPSRNRVCTDWVSFRQEDRPHGGDQVAEHADVVPFHGVSNDGSAEGFFQHGLVDYIDVVNGQPPSFEFGQTF